MLKLSYMARAQDHDSYDGLIAFAKNIRLDMIDFHVMGELQNRDFLRQIKFRCLRAGLPIGYFASGVSMVGPAQQRAERLARAKADTDSASYIGAQVVHTFARHQWPETEEEQEVFWQPMIEDYQELCDYAAAQGVIVSLQNHNHGSFAMNAHQVLRILREVKRRNLTYILDSGQWEGSRGGSPRGWHNTELDIYREYHARVAPYSTGVRAKIYKIDNGYEEWLDYPRFFKILRDADYNGAVSIVFEGGVPLRNRFDKERCIEMGATHLRECMTRAYA
jgi:sugar phosphate isomerase/epimerase